MEKHLMQIKKVISSLLMVPDGLTYRTLLEEYERLNGPLPYKKFGFSNNLEFLKSMNDILKYSYHSFNQDIIFQVIPSEDTQHLYDLVQKQKKKPVKKRPGFNPTPQYKLGQPLNICDRRATTEKTTNNLPLKPRNGPPSFLTSINRLKIINIMLLNPQGIYSSQLHLLYFKHYGDVLSIKVSDLLKYFPEFFTTIENNLEKITLTEGIYDHEGISTKLFPIKESNLIPIKTKNHIFQVLSRSPNGIIAFDFQARYKNLIGTVFDETKYGFSSFEELVYSMPDIFSIVERDADILIKLPNSLKANKSKASAKNFKHDNISRAYPNDNFKSHKEHLDFSDDEMQISLPKTSCNSIQNLKRNPLAKFDKPRYVKKLFLIEQKYIFHLIRHDYTLLMSVADITSLFSKHDAVSKFLSQNKQFPIITLTASECPPLFHQLEKYHIKKSTSSVSIELLSLKHALLAFYLLGHPLCKQITSELILHLKNFDPNNLEWNDFSENEQELGNAPLRPPTCDLDALCISDIKAYVKKFRETIDILMEKQETEDDLDNKIAFFKSKLKQYKQRQTELEIANKEVEAILKPLFDNNHFK